MIHTSMHIYFKVNYVRQRELILDRERVKLHLLRMPSCYWDGSDENKTAETRLWVNLSVECRYRSKAWLKSTHERTLFLEKLGCEKEERWNNQIFSTVIQEEEEAERKTNLLIERLRCREKQRFVVFKLGTGHRSSTSRQPLLCLLKEAS